MSKTLPARFWTETEAGWGTRPDGYTVHRDEAEATKNVADYWAKERARNPGGATPAEYSYPTETSIMVEVSDDLFDEVQEKGTVWAHYTSHLPSHAASWSKREAR